MRIKWRRGVLGALIAASLMLTNGSLPAEDAPVVHVSAVVKRRGCACRPKLTAHSNTPRIARARPSLWSTSAVCQSAIPAGARMLRPTW